MFVPWKESYDKPRQYIQKQRHHFVKKGLSSQSYGFSSSQVRMWELDHKEGWRPKNRCFQTMLLEKNLESPLDSKEIKAVNPKGNQSWIFIGKTDAGAPILWPPDAKSQLFGKDADAGKDWRQGEKGMTENKRVGWYHWLNGHEFEQTLADSEGQGSLGCCSPWGHKELDTTEWLKNNNKEHYHVAYLKKYVLLGTSLVVEWLRLHASSAEVPGHIPGQGTRSYVLQLKCSHVTKKTEDPVCCN